MNLLFLLLFSFSWSQAPLKTVIRDVEAATEYRFLYRDALIAPVKVTLSTTEGRLIQDLQSVLAAHGIGLQVDLKTKQVLVFARTTTAAGAPIQELVLDDVTGSRLPYATVMWLRGDAWTGAVADDQGRFAFSFPSGQESLLVMVRYVGYRPTSVTLTPDAAQGDLAVRLVPDPLVGNDIVIERRSIHSSADSLWITMSANGGTTGFSEPGALRALQPLAAVSSGGAISNGLHIRGSKPDGLQILLDGVPVYNHTHLFGLFDPFNQDALTALGFYYGITPATYAGLPGGTLSYSTKTASQNSVQGSFGTSNSAFRGTLEAPLIPGRASLLVSGRKSYLNVIDWFGNAALIRWGLDVDRETSDPQTSAASINSRTVFPEDSDARFHDFHVKVFFEERDGADWALSFYNGDDNTLQRATRSTRPTGTLQLVSRDVETKNQWGSTVISLQRHWRVSTRARMRAVASVSRYQADYFKDDFLYVRYNRTNDRLIPSLNLFSQTNELFESQVSMNHDWFPGNAAVISSGAMVRSVSIDYEERSVQRPSYSTTTGSAQVDLYSQADLQNLDWMHLTAGIRTHYFSLGNVIRFSPRVQMMLLPRERVRFGAGYSVNHQFLHSVSLKQQSSADIWVSSSSDQPPSSSTHLTAGVYAWLDGGVSAQVEAYRKDAENVRTHEVNPSLLITQDASLESPWFTQNQMNTTGIETQVSGRHTGFDWMLGYTNSHTELRNPALNNGEAFAADWDRRHSLSAHASIRPFNRLSLHVGGYAASGSPNTATEFGSDDGGRLDSYFRMDAGARYRFTVGKSVVDATLSVFNVLDRDNVWYRSPVLINNQSVRPPTLEFENLDVYDLGRLMSFDLSVKF